MKLRYLVVDGQGQLQRVRRSQIEALWQGRLHADELGCDSQTELRLVSVLLNGRLQPRKLYLLRLPLEGGIFNADCHQRLCVFLRPDCVTAREVVQHHTDGWPGSFFPQMAVALDVPVAQLNLPLGIGGPLLVAAAMRLTPKQAVRYLK